MRRQDQIDRWKCEGWPARAATLGYRAWVGSPAEAGGRGNGSGGVRWGLKPLRAHAKTASPTGWWRRETRGGEVLEGPALEEGWVASGRKANRPQGEASPARSGACGETELGRKEGGGVTPAATASDRDEPRSEGSRVLRHLGLSPQRWRRLGRGGQVERWPVADIGAYIVMPHREVKCTSREFLRGQ